MDGRNELGGWMDEYGGRIGMADGWIDDCLDGWIGWMDGWNDR